MTPDEVKGAQQNKTLILSCGCKVKVKDTEINDCYQWCPKHKNMTVIRYIEKRYLDHNSKSTNS